MKIQIKILSILLILAGAASVAEAADESADEKQQLIDIMKTVDLVSLDKDVPFCQAFYEDFRQQRNIEHIQPIVKADRYDDPALRPYQERCPKLDFRLSREFLVRGIDVSSLPEDYFEGDVGIPIYGVGNFQLYKVDIDNNPEDGEELVFYYEGERVEDRRLKWDGTLTVDEITLPEARAYHVLDLDACKIIYGAGFNRGGSAKWTRNGIIRYKGKNAIYTLESWGGTEQPSYHFLELWMYSEKLKRMAPVCAYANLHQER